MPTSAAYGFSIDMNYSANAPIFLVGYRGTGKTTVAPELARLLEYAWVDSDDEIERRAGKSITAIFADDGEAAFRDWEGSVVAELAGRQRTVVALGGGAILREENRRVVRQAGPVIWLTATVDTILRRIIADGASPGRRPNLTKSGGRAEIETILAKRTPIYRQCATLVVDTEGKSAAQVADEIRSKL
jgi:shikimate kinase